MELNQENADEATVGNIQKRNEVFRYGECTKNQASAINLKAFDGCLEFMPAGDVGTLEALSCAACNCHRNFHRKEVVVQNHGAFQQHDHMNRWEFHMTASQPSGSRNNMGSPGFSGTGGSSKKRVRTRFTQNQKDRMLAFAQGLGWCVKQEHEGDVHGFCAEMGINSNVFKVWMRNNKHTLGKLL